MSRFTTEPRLTSIAQPLHWQARMTFFSADITHIESLGSECCAALPSLESLERRFSSTDQAWIEKWVADDVDPSQPN